MKLFKKISSYGAKKLCAFLVWILSLILYFPSIFFLFYFVFQHNKGAGISEQIPVFILMGLVAFGLYAYHRLLRKWVKRIKTPILGGVIRGLIRMELILYLTVTFFFTTKAYPNASILAYLTSMCLSFFASAMLEGLSLKIADIPEWEE